MKKSTLLIVVAAILFAAGCKKNSKDDTKQTSRENILAKNAHIIDTLAVSTSSSSSLILSKSNLSFTPAIGDIILASPSANDPLGLMVKLTSVVDDGTNLTCATQRSNLNEAFTQLFIDYTYNQAYQDNFQAKGTGSLGSALGITFNHNKTFASGLEISGNLALSFPQTGITYRKHDGEMFPDTVIVAAGFTTAGSNLSITCTALQVNEIVIHEFKNLPVILVPVEAGPIPLLIPFTQKVVLSFLPLSLNGKITCNLYPAVTASLGFSYINGEWKNLSEFDISTTADKLNKNDFDDEVQGQLTMFKPKYEISPLGLDSLNGYFEMPAELELTIQRPTPNYSLDAKLDVAAGIHAEFWNGKLEFDRSISATAVEHNFLKGNWDSCSNLYVGKEYQGGIIAYLLQPSDTGFRSNECHGLIAAKNDLPIKAPWGCFSGFIWTYPFLGSGYKNTHAIIDSCNDFPNAAQLCADLSLNGYHDWFLPSQDELNKLHENKNLIGNFQSDWYWSSNCYNGIGNLYGAFCQVFGDKYLQIGYTDGFQAGTSKADLNFVRPIRKF